MIFRIHVRIDASPLILHSYSRFRNSERNSFGNDIISLRVIFVTIEGRRARPGPLPGTTGSFAPKQQGYMDKGRRSRREGPQRHRGRERERERER